MFGQRASELLARAPIHDYGCALLCCAALAWDTGDPHRQLTPADVIAAYDQCNADGSLTDRDGRPGGCFIQRWQRVIEALGGSAIYLGHRSALAPLAAGERAIELWTLDRPRGAWRHFVYGSYDPWPRSITRRDGRLSSLRVFQVSPQ